MNKKIEQLVQEAAFAVVRAESAVKRLYAETGQQCEFMAALDRGEYLAPSKCPCSRCVFSTGVYEYEREHEFEIFPQ